MQLSAKVLFIFMRTEPALYLTDQNDNNSNQYRNFNFTNNIKYFSFFVKNILMFITHVSSNIHGFVSASINGDCFSGFRNYTVCGLFYRIVINKIYYYCCPRLHETFKLIHLYIMFMLHRSKLFLNSIDANSRLSLINQLPANCQREVTKPHQLK